jgi:hypothetical protein
VQTGGGYIFFKRRSNPIAARTQDFVIIEKGQHIEFTFTDNTVIDGYSSSSYTYYYLSLDDSLIYYTE